MPEWLKIVMFYSSLVCLIPGAVLFILGMALSGKAKGSFQTTHFNALAWTSGTQTHHYHYKEQDELGEKIFWWALLPLIAGVALYPGIVWWLKIIIFIVGLFVLIVMSALIPDNAVYNIAIKLKVRQKPLTEEEKKARKVKETTRKLMSVLGSQQETEKLLRTLTPAQQADFMDLFNKAMDESREDDYRQKCIFVLSDYFYQARKR